MSELDQAILDYIAANPNKGRDDIRRHVAPDVSAPTIWRALKRLVDDGRLEVTGRARATSYTLAGSAVVRDHLKTPYNQRKPVTYQREFLDRYFPNKTFYIPEPDRARLHEAGRPAPPPVPAGTYARRILERLLIDLSWASSRMEGNTYDLLETERLIRFGQEAVGKDRKEAIMIINHKEAIQYVVDNLDQITLSRATLFDIHAFLSDGLLADPAMAGQLRLMPVGITHSNYTPLGDQFSIAEEFTILIEKAAAITDPFEQSFFLLVHVPYLQAFADTNKRTSRIAANIPLLKAGLAPMSFFTMNDRDYIDGLIGVYELNNLSLLRDAFIEAYLASAANYRVIRAEVETPEKAAVAYREFVRTAVRRCVRDWQAFDADRVMALAAEAGIPDDDRQDVVDYVGREFAGLHEGNAIRYRLTPEDLAGIARARE